MIFQVVHIDNNDNSSIYKTVVQVGRIHPGHGKLVQLIFEVYLTPEEIEGDYREVIQNKIVDMLNDTSKPQRMIGDAWVVEDDFIDIDFEPDEELNRLVENKTVLSA